MAVTPSSALDEPNIPTTYTQLVARELGLQLKDIPQLLANTSLSAEALLADNTQLSTTQQLRIIDNALALTDDPIFGLTLGQQMGPSTHGALGFLANTSATLMQAFQALTAYSPTRMNFVRLEFNPQPEETIFKCHFDIELSPEALRCLSEMCAMVMFACAETILGRPAHEIEIGFSYPKPRHGDRYSEFLPGEVKFGMGELVARLPTALMEAENAAANREAYLMAKAQCDRMLSQLNSSANSYQFKIEKLMLSNPAGVPSEEEVAAALFMSKRTLARHLKTEGSSFRQIRDSILARQAASYLRDNRLPVETVATLLNYHDSASFRRAFKRWYGVTPKTYKQQSNSPD